ncbi:MAG: hypothetical protein K6A43_11040 [Treponema sp.]|nr:hypothetical protein [Treponema sp.]
MKKFSKLVGAALLASVFAFGFASCSNGSSDDSNNSGSNNLEKAIDSNAIAVYVGYDYSHEATYVINCYSDGTFVERVNIDNKTYDDAKGTYELTDNDFDNSVGSINITHSVQDESLELKNFEYSAPITITDGKFTFFSIIFTRKSTNEAKNNSDNFPVVFLTETTNHGEVYSTSFVFYEDKTWEQFDTENSETTKIGKGTYKFTNGNFSDGTLILTCTQFINDKTKTLENVENFPDEVVYISNSIFIVDSDPDISLIFIKQ